MIFITAKFAVLPEHAEEWPEISRGFTDATRAEEGCLWFEWSRSLDDPNEYVLVEAFRDDEAGAAHVGSDHFQAATQALPPYLSATPRIVSQSVDQDGWSELGELAGRLTARGAPVRDGAGPCRVDRAPGWPGQRPRSPRGRRPSRPEGSATPTRCR